MSAYGGLAALTGEVRKKTNKYRHFLWGLLPKIGPGSGGEAIRPNPKFSVTCAAHAFASRPANSFLR